MEDATSTGQASKPTGCDIMNSLSRLEAERFDMMLTDEGMAHVRKALLLQAAQHRAVANEHEASHQLAAGLITQQQYDAVNAALSAVQRDIDSELQAEQAFYVDIDARIADARRRLMEHADMQAMIMTEVLGALTGGGRSIGGMPNGFDEIAPGVGMRVTAIGVGDDLGSRASRWRRRSGRTS